MKKKRSINIQSFVYLDNRPLCSINRPGLGQLERVQITSYSINIEFKNIFNTVKCSSIHTYLSITNTQTNQLERTIEVNRTFFFSLSNFNSCFSLRIFNKIVFILIVYFQIKIIP